MLDQVSECVSDTGRNEVGGVAEKQGAVGDRSVARFTEIWLLLLLWYHLSSCFQLYTVYTLTHRYIMQSDSYHLSDLLDCQAKVGGLKS